MKKAVTQDKPCKCPECGSDLILLIDCNGRAHRYLNIIGDRNVERIKNELDGLSLSNMRCFDCKKEFPIDWSWILPRALHEYPDNISFYTPDNF